ncbi:zinc finger CCCH domain-containing protein 20-like [Magnolia sinica]|uniref:zinc finger CCCH domain-containing protein 20-like n=1 Tax=Magnolia sinica TaxID=86752 RepID=UPI0026581995|nr:zinc finger CCCH domain-containing protein 20-like [Magnolia sinica]
MMLGEGTQPNPTIHVPPWAFMDDSTAGMHSPIPISGVSVNANGGDYSPFLIGEALTALQRYLPSNETGFDDSDSEVVGRESDFPVDAYSCDEFRMYEFKVRRCARGRAHDWTECPYAHPGEKARRRDPRKFHYSGTACPDFRKGSCKRGDSCEFAHGVFECWLHPARYRTQPCKDGTSCRRRVCFFAHTPEQLRILSPSSQQHSPRTPIATADSFDGGSYDGSPLRHVLDAAGPHLQKSLFLPSPTSTLMSPPLSPPSDSPPLSPIRRPMLSSSVNEVLASLRQLQLNKVKSMPRSRWGPHMSPVGSCLSTVFSSLPSTPTASRGWMDGWDGGCLEEEPMERVESGRELRSKIYEKLSKENSLETTGAGPTSVPDVGWVSELVK